jgi:hypothetical protein
MIPQDDQLAPVRGILWALPIGLTFWCALLLAVGWAAL